MGQAINSMSSSSSCYIPQDNVLDSQSIHKIHPKTNDNNAKGFHSLTQYPLFPNNGNIKNYNENVLQLNKIIKIQSYYRFYSYASRYPPIKQKQKQEESYFISSLLSQYITFATKQAESSLGYLIKPLSFKYTPKYDYGLILSTKIILIESIVPSFYIGNVNILNQRHGYGTLYYQNGSKYEGHWKNNNFTGYSRFIDEEGNLFQGYFTNWYLNGNGIKRTLSGSSFSGNFVNNIKEGKGKEVTQDTIYQGEFHNDQYHGTGILKNLREKWEYQGQFANNAFEGIGIMTNNQGEKSQGEFIRGKMINNLSMSSLLTSTIESEKDQIKVTMTTETNEKTICFPLLSRHRKHFSALS